MRKWLARTAFGLMTAALFVMTAHIFTHIRGSSAENFIHCRLCQNLAGISVPAAPVVAPPAAAAPEVPLPQFPAELSLPAAHGFARAPPAA